MFSGITVWSVLCTHQNTGRNLRRYFKEMVTGMQFAVENRLWEVERFSSVKVASGVSVQKN